MASRKKATSTRPAKVPSDAFTAGVEDEAQASPLATAPIPSGTAEPPASSPSVPEGTQPASAIPPEPTLHGIPDTVHPGFAMSDDPAIPPQFLRSSPHAPSPHPGGSPPPARSPGAVPAVPAANNGPVAYEHRIRVLEAFHYDGQVHRAPGWVLRDWVAYADNFDDRRGLPPGPALNVPTPRTPTGFTMCRKGDYIVRQEVLLAPGVAPDIQIEVWEGDAFERLFIPVQPTGQEAA